MARKVKSAYDRTKFVRMTEEVDVFDLADMLLLRQPVIVNFEEAEPIESNRVIIFLSGVIYALDGEVIVIREKVFAFATKSDLKERSLRKFINEHKE